MALASIYADPNYHTLSHVGIISTLQRKGVEVLQPADGTSLNETTLTQNAPIRMVRRFSEFRVPFTIKNTFREAEGRAETIVEYPFHLEFSAH